MIDPARALRDLEDVEHSLTEYVRRAMRRHPDDTELLLAHLEEWLGPIARAQTALRQSTPKRNHAC